MPADMPLVSVVIPTYNYAQYVGEAVESALAQTYPAVEVIVVDDGSTDGTADRLATYGNRIRYIYQPNQGLSAARNTGIRAANGRYVALLDSDDLFHPRRLEIQVPIAEQSPNVGIVASDHTEGVDPFWATIPPDPIRVDDVSMEDLIIRPRFGSCGVLIRKDCLATVGMFEVSLRSAEDRDMWIRIASRFRIVLVRAALWWYRMTPGSMSRHPERMEQYERAVLDRAFQMPEVAGRCVLRHKALGLAALSSAWTFYSAGRSMSAARRLAESFYWWPFPFAPTEIRHNFVRIRLLVAALKAVVFRHRTQPSPS